MFERYKIKKLLKPPKAFTQKTRIAFLAVFDAAHRSEPYPSEKNVVAGRGFTIAIRSIIVAVALIAVFAGVSVYADTANVAADSPLYPLKRLDESVQLAVAAPAQKAQLQAVFATRRADEINDLEARKPSSTIISGLSKDLNTDIDASLNDAETAKLGDGQLKNFCSKVFSVIATSSMETHAKTRSQIMAKFITQCDMNSTSSRFTAFTASSTATSTPPSLSPSPSSPPSHFSPSRHIQLNLKPVFDIERSFGLYC